MEEEQFFVEHPGRVTVRSTGSFWIRCSKRIVGPPNSTWRLFQFDTQVDDGEYTIGHVGHWEFEWFKLQNAETVDSRPIEVGLQQPPSLREEVRKYIAQELYQQQDKEVESPEEADDFEIFDEPELISGYEYEEMDRDNSLESQVVAKDNGTSTTEESNDGREQVDERATTSEGAGADARGPKETHRDVGKPVGDDARRNGHNEGGVTHSGPSGG